MRVLRIGLEAPAVSRWQQFLKDQRPAVKPGGFYTGPIDGVFGRDVRRATRDYQKWLLTKPVLGAAEPARTEFMVDAGSPHARTYRVKRNGLVDAATTMAAKPWGFVPEPEFEMGPDTTECKDLLASRPYFLVPLPEPPTEKQPVDSSMGASERDDDPDQRDERAKVRARIGKWIKLVYPEPTTSSPSVTDIYIFSHGWHRNFYQAVSAYDRLSGRIARLARSGRFDRGTFRPSEDEDFRPLFLNFHWHSDPGEDDFVDKSGRRDKTSFMQRVASAFEPKDKSPDGGIRMTVDFENIFAILSRMAAPDTRSLSDNDIVQKSQDLFARLDAYQLKDLPEPIDLSAVLASRPGKCAIVWTCYHEADCRQVLLRQDEDAEPFLGVVRAAVTFGKFILALTGAVIAATLVGKAQHWVRWPALNAPVWAEAVLAGCVLLFFWLLTGVSYRDGEVPGTSLDAGEPSSKAEGNLQILVRQMWRLWSLLEFAVITILCLALIKVVMLLPLKAYHWVLRVREAGWRLPQFDGAHYLAKVLPLLHYSVKLAGWLCLVALACWLALAVLGDIRTRSRFKSGRNSFTFAILFWAPLEVAVAVPVATYLLFTYFFGRACALIPRLSNLYGERTGTPNDITGDAHEGDFRDRLAIAARLPIKLVQNVLARDSSAIAPLDVLDGLLAFYEMQRKGVAAGNAAASFLCRLFAEATELQDPVTGKPHPKMRIHMIGHSFGALVVTNMTRYLALKRPQGSPDSIHTLCLLEGALASDWYRGETALSSYVSGSIASVYSRYDTANGFYYPVSNNARMATGFVGMTSANVPLVVTRERFVLLVEPPNLEEAQYSPDKEPPAKPAPFHWLNLDASRIIYQGAPASGGGHTDIYKDDVIHLLWAVTRQTSESGPVIR